MAGQLKANALAVAAVTTTVAGVLMLAAWPLGAFLHFNLPLSTALWWDAGLSLLFFLQHSGMVRQSVRSALRIAEPYQIAVYATASGITLMAVMLLWQRAGDTLVRWQGVWLIAACVVALAAAAFFLWGIVALRGFDPCGVRPIRAHLKGKPLPHLPFVARGPYRWVRHPLYFAIVVLFWCYPEITPDRLLFNVLWTAWIWVGAKLEERDLVREFGEAYRQYQRQVPALVPWRRPLRLRSGR